MASAQQLVVLVGLPGSGKSRVTEQLEEDGWGVVSQGRLGNKMKCERLTKRLLIEGRNVVVDRRAARATNYEQFAPGASRDRGHGKC